MLLNVRTFSRERELGAYKILEESAEVQVSYKKWRDRVNVINERLDWGENTFVHELFEKIDRENLEDELADLIQATCNFAEMRGLDIEAGLKRVFEKNRRRGFYG